MRTHGTTGCRPIDRFAEEAPHLLPVPSRDPVAPVLRAERRVGRDGLVAWNHAWYGVPWQWAGLSRGAHRFEVAPGSGSFGRLGFVEAETVVKHADH